MTQKTHRLVRAALFASLLAMAPLSAAPAADGSAIENRIEQLDAGEFVWDPSGAEAGPVEIVISLGQQKAYVFRSGELIGGSTISSGRPGYESPVGRFQILQKKVMHRSNRYESAPMPYMQRLNWYGVALHAGQIPGRPASHGCIRLPSAFAKKLFAETQVGSFVFVTDDPLQSSEAALKLARANASAPMPSDRMPGGAGS